jgi:hypothetical protein
LSSVFISAFILGLLHVEPNAREFYAILVAARVQRCKKALIVERDAAGWRLNFENKLLAAPWR